MPSWIRFATRPFILIIVIYAAPAFCVQLGGSDQGVPVGQEVPRKTSDQLRREQIDIQRRLDREQEQERRYLDVERRRLNAERRRRPPVHPELKPAPSNTEPQQ